MDAIEYHPPLCSAFQPDYSNCLAFQFNNLSTLLRLIFVCAQCETSSCLQSGILMRMPFSLQNHFRRTDWLCVPQLSKNNRSWKALAKRSTSTRQFHWSWNDSPATILAERENFIKIGWESIQSFDFGNAKLAFKNRDLVCDSLDIMTHTRIAQCNYKVTFKESETKVCCKVLPWSVANAFNFCLSQ